MTTNVTPQPVAYEVTLKGERAIVFAASAAKARWAAVRSYWEAYGREHEWPSVRATRAPRLDGALERSRGSIRPGRAHDPSFVEDYA
jgi:hypothetical protein